MALELSVFDPGSIQELLDRDLAAGLRELAAALEAGELAGRCVRAEGVGSKGGDASVLMRIVVSAPVRTLRRVDDVKRLDVGDEREETG